MATKTNSANGTSNRPSATEIKSWYEKNKHSLEMYANAKDALFNLLRLFQRKI